MGTSPTRPTPPVERDDRWFKAFVFFAATIALGYAALMFRGGVDLIPAERARPASALALRTLDGSELDLRALRGRVVLVNAWASWCGYCRREIPTLRRLHADHAADGLVVIGVNVETPDELGDTELAELADSWGIEYAVVRPTAGFAGSFAFSGGIPHTWLIDREGRLRGSHRGRSGGGALERACQRLLAETPAADADSATSTRVVSRAITSSQR